MALKVGIQLYSVRELMKQDPIKTIYQVADAGYKYLDELYPGLSDRERAEKICQAKGLDFGMFLTPEEIRRKLDLSGE